MTTFAEFRTKCRMRHDFADQIQVRYSHKPDLYFDTWVSGEEVLQRLRSSKTEADLKKMRELDRDYLIKLKTQLTTEMQFRLEREIRDLAANQADGFIGGNIIGDSLVDTIRGNEKDDNSSISDRQRWGTILIDESFRQGVLELAWIQLEGSFPDDEEYQEQDDWN